MNTFNPELVAEQAHDTYRKATAVPESVRALAEKTVAQTREAYDSSKDALEAAVVTFERSFDAAGQGAAAFNRKIIDIAQGKPKFRLRPSQKLGWGKEPRRDRGVADGLLAQTARHTDGPG
jgi:hypothetical protein